MELAISNCELYNTDPPPPPDIPFDNCRLSAYDIKAKRSPPIRDEPDNYTIGEFTKSLPPSAAVGWMRGPLSPFSFFLFLPQDRAGQGKAVGCWFVRNVGLERDKKKTLPGRVPIAPIIETIKTLQNLGHPPSCSSSPTDRTFNDKG